MSGRRVGRRSTSPIPTRPTFHDHHRPSSPHVATAHERPHRAPRAMAAHPTRVHLHDRPQARPPSCQRRLLVACHRRHQHGTYTSQLARRACGRPTCRSHLPRVLRLPRNGRSTSRPPTHPRHHLRMCGHVPRRPRHPVLQPEHRRSNSTDCPASISTYRHPLRGS